MTTTAAPLKNDVALKGAGPVWRGEPGRIEVFYATFATSEPGGTAYWVHCETVSPVAGHGAPYGHGWVAIFRPEETPVVERFGPEPVMATDPGDPWFCAGDVEVGPGRMTGTAGKMAWDLSFDDQGPSLWTFPAKLWGRSWFPGAQVVPWPRAAIAGTFAHGGSAQTIEATGAVARIYGHGNAEHWGWLHADLGDGALIEIVAAVPHRIGLRRLGPLTMVRLRRPGRSDWPASALLGAVFLRAKLGANHFSVAGTLGGRRLRVDVSVPPEQSVVLDYVDPDGAGAVCTNSERADAEVTIERWHGRWIPEQRWTVNGTAHAEVGWRPSGRQDRRVMVSE